MSGPVGFSPQSGPRDGKLTGPSARERDLPSEQYGHRGAGLPALTSASRTCLRMAFMTPMKEASSFASSRAASFFSVFFLLLFSDPGAAMLARAHRRRADPAREHAPAGCRAANSVCRRSARGGEAGTSTPE